MDYNEPSPGPEATETRAEQQLRLLAELTDMAMDLTRATHARAREEIAETGYPAAETTREFARLSRAARQAIALEARLTQTPATAQASRQAAAPRPFDPRRARIAAELHTAARKSPQNDRRALARHIDERVDGDDVQDALAANLPLADIIAYLSNKLGLPFDIAKVPDDLLEPGIPDPAAPPTSSYTLWSHVRDLGTRRRKWIALAPDRTRRTGPGGARRAKRILLHPGRTQPAPPD